MPSIREMRYFEGMEIVEHESDDDTDEEDVSYEDLSDEEKEWSEEDYKISKSLAEYRGRVENMIEIIQEELKYTVVKDEYDEEYRDDLIEEVNFLNNLPDRNLEDIGKIDWMKLVKIERNHEEFGRCLQLVKADLISRLNDDDDSDDDLDEEFHHQEINEIEEVKEEKIKEEEFQQNYEIKGVIDILREQLRHNSVEIQNIKRHIEESIKVKQYPCTECDTICVFPSDLQRHMRKHEENMEDSDEEDDAERCENTSASSDIKELNEEKIEKCDKEGETEKVEIEKLVQEVENGKESSKVSEENVEGIGIHNSKLKISSRKKKRKKQKKGEWNEPRKSKKSRKGHDTEPRKWKSIKIINGKMSKIQEYLVIFSKIKKKKNEINRKLVREVYQT